MNGYTKGPWRAEVSGPEIQIWADRVEGRVRHRECVAVMNGAPTAQAMVDAQIIAAAPDLLAACDAAETMLRCLPDTTTNAGGTKPTMTTAHALAIVRAAIAKAQS